MKTKTILKKSSYAKLVRDVRKIIEEGKLRAQSAAAKELTQAYWRIGQRILNENLSENTGYLTAILEDLSDELSVDVSTLHRAIHFAQTYPTIKKIPSLNWSQFKLLLPMGDTKKRKYYEVLSQKNKLNFRDLRSEIKKGRYEEEQPQSNAKRIAANTLTRPTEASYVYKGVIERVIDGDTLLIRLDLGFQVWREQRLRLAGIDAPASDQEGGEAATRFVREQLAQVTFVMVKTNKIDIYGRYVGHIFYLPDEKDKAKVFENGHYLNEQLLSKGLAAPY